MAKFFIILTFLLALIFKCQALYQISVPSDAVILISSTPTGEDCGSMITDTMECLPYLLEDQSQPDDLCCSAIESVVSIDPECICEMMGSNNMPLDLKKALALPTICGLRLPCNVHASPAPSPADAPGPSDGEILVPSLAPEGENVVPSPNPGPSPTPMPTPSPSHAPNSPMPMPLPSPPMPMPLPSPKSTISSASLLAHPHFILAMVLFTNIFFVYF